MTLQQELTETLLKYLSDPVFEISSISLRTKERILHLGLDRNVYTLTKEPFDGILIEDMGLYGGGTGLRSILESMRTEEISER